MVNLNITQFACITLNDIYVTSLPFLFKLIAVALLAGKCVFIDYVFKVCQQALIKTNTMVNSITVHLRLELIFGI